ncbi:MAG: type II toxin-antitoxin system RelE/ParE family toxin [Deltaproteobacteria bacterium]|nr:type II toxin-antitoxin system RelE/ParE family toxin [Deltaproteobacteria bacterium]
MKRAFKTKTFNRWMSKAGLEDDVLREAVAEMEQGLFDADLGSGLVKKRVGLSGKGKRGGARTIVATNYCGTWFFLFGYQKNERANISKRDEEVLKLLGAKLLRMNDSLITAAIMAGQIKEIAL